MSTNRQKCSKFRRVGGDIHPSYFTLPANCFYKNRTCLRYTVIMERGAVEWIRIPRLREEPLLDKAPEEIVTIALSPEETVSRILGLTLKTSQIAETRTRVRVKEPAFSEWFVF